MDIYEYTAEDKSFQLPLSIYELHLLHHIPYTHTWEYSVTVAIEYGVTRSIETSLLLDKVRRLHEIINNENELLQYRYSFKEIAPDSCVLSSGAGSRTGCFYQGQLLHAKAGPGVCALRKYESFDIGGGHQQSEAIRVLDMRDMKAVTLDSGEVLKPQRRRKEVQLQDKIHGLLKFLESVDAEQVFVTASYSR